MKMTLKNVRLSFPNLFTPGEKFNKYGASFLFEEGGEVHKALEKTMLDVAKDKWGAKGESTLKTIKSTLKCCLHSGGEKADYAGYEGNMFLASVADKAPKVKDLDGRTNLTEGTDRIYSGCYVNAVVDIWAQDNGWGKRINAKLLGVQFLRDGDSFEGGATLSDDDFEDLSVADKDDDFDFEDES